MSFCESRIEDHTVINPQHVAEDSADHTHIVKRLPRVAARTCPDCGEMSERSFTTTE